MIRQANLDDVAELLPLFDAYRVFHKQASDLEGARAFLKERFISKEANVFIACISATAQAVGFVLLYQGYSNLSMKPIIILNDLFVLSEYRGQGVGQLLIQEAKSYAREKRASKLSLFTIKENVTAKRLYEYLGFVCEQGFDMYELIL
ncbi:MAG: GNAT family N-acetyltransferase [Deinococcales bacterium]